MLGFFSGPSQDKIPAGGLPVINACWKLPTTSILPSIGLDVSTSKKIKRDKPVIGPFKAAKPPNYKTLEDFKFEAQRPDSVGNAMPSSFPNRRNVRLYR